MKLAILSGNPKKDGLCQPFFEMVMKFIRIHEYLVDSCIRTTSRSIIM